MSKLIKKLRRIQQLELPNGVKDAVWLEDVIKVVKKSKKKKDEK